MPICARRTSNLVWTPEHPPPILAFGEAAVIDTLQARTKSDGSDAQAPEHVRAAEIYPSAGSVPPPKHGTPVRVPQGKVGYGGRGLFCGWTMGPASGHSAMAGRESSV